MSKVRRTLITLCVIAMFGGFLAGLHFTETDQIKEMTISAAVACSGFFFGIAQLPSSGHPFWYE